MARKKSSDPELLKTLRAELRRAGIPDKSKPMQSYMKSDMPFHGVPNPTVRKICKIIFREMEFGSAEQWRSDVLAVWRGAEFREERYAALHLAKEKRARAFQNMSAVPMYEELIVDGAWWDYIDDIAHRVGEILHDHPQAMNRKMRSWSHSENMWKRRISILCQLDFKSATDLKLLYACIEPSLDSKEFFLRKAIGWALRQYAWVDPKEIVRYVQKNEAKLSPLSQREALKNVRRISPKPKPKRV